MDPVSFILFVLFGVLGIFILVRIVKAASRTVDREQQEKRGASSPPREGGETSLWHQARMAASGSDVPPQPAPPQAPLRKPKEVKLGMTPEEVESALGPPQTKADLGEKILYKYEGLTAEFKAGKVVDVR